MDQNYTNVNQNMYSMNAPVYKMEKEDKIGLGVASLFLGIISLFSFLIIYNMLVAVVSIVLGAVQLVKYKNKSFAIFGIIFSAVAIILTFVFQCFCSEILSTLMAFFRQVDFSALLGW